MKVHSINERALKYGGREVELLWIRGSGVQHANKAHISLTIHLGLSAA